MQSKRYIPGSGFRSAPVNQVGLIKGRAKSGMPKLAKNPNYQAPKPAKKKAAPKKKATVARQTAATPKKSLPPLRTHASLSRQAKAQTRDNQGKFVPVNQRGFFGKVKAVFNGEMQEHITKNQAALKRQESALRKRQQQGNLFYGDE